MEENPFWGEPTPTDLWDDMDKLNELYDNNMDPSKHFPEKRSDKQ